jgi:hypothetical protein
MGSTSCCGHDIRELEVATLSTVTQTASSSQAILEKESYEASRAEKLGVFKLTKKFLPYVPSTVTSANDLLQLSF